MIRRQLGIETIDLLQFHVWDDTWTDEPDFGNTVDKLKQDGVISNFGLSLNRWEPENGIKAMRTGLVDAVQVIYSIFDQSPEDELFPACQELNVGVIVRVALDEGSLGGKMTKDTTFPKNDWRSRYFNPREFGEHAGAGGETQADSSAGDVAAGNGVAVCAVTSGGEHDDYRDAEAGPRAGKHRAERQRTALAGVMARVEEASLGPETGAVVGLGLCWISQDQTRRSKPSQK